MAASVAARKALDRSNDTESVSSVTQSDSSKRSYNTNGNISGWADEVKAPKKRAIPSYDYSADGVKGSLRIPGVFKGTEEVVKVSPTENRIDRNRAVLGGLAKREERYVGIADENGELQGLVRSSKTQSNPLRTRKVSYDDISTEGGLKAGRRDMDVRFVGTNVGYKYNETDKGRQYTQVRAVAYSMDIKDNDNSFKKNDGLQQRDTSLLGIIKRRYDLDAEGKQTLTGRQNLLSSKYTDQISEEKTKTATSRFGGVISKTYEKPVGAGKDDNTDRFVSKRRVFTYAMEAKPVTADSDGVKTQQLGHFGTFFKRTVTIPREGDEKTVNMRILGVGVTRKVNMTDEEKTLRARQLPPLERPDVGQKNFVQRVATLGKEAYGTVRDGALHAREKPMEALSYGLKVTGNFAAAPVSNTFAGLSYVAGRLAKDTPQSVPEKPASKIIQANRQTPLVNTPNEKSVNPSIKQDTAVTASRPSEDTYMMRAKNAASQAWNKTARYLAGEPAQAGAGTPGDTPTGTSPSRAARPGQIANADQRQGPASVPRQILARSNSNASDLSVDSGYESASAGRKNEGPRSLPAQAAKSPDAPQSSASAPATLKSQRQPSNSSISAKDIPESEGYFINGKPPANSTPQQRQTDGRGKGGTEYGNIRTSVESSSDVTVLASNRSSKYDERERLSGRGR